MHTPTPNPDEIVILIFLRTRMWGTRVCVEFAWGFSNSPQMYYKLNYWPSLQLLRLSFNKRGLSFQLTTPSADVQLGIPMEMHYADDTDFISTSHSYLEDVMKVLDTELPPRHLICTAEKTQRIHVFRESEEWQKAKTLGALLGENQDVTRRMLL